MSKINQELKMRKYYFRNVLGNYIAVIHGKCNQISTDVTNQEDADYLNESQGIGLADVKAAEICSIGGNWDDFMKIKANCCAVVNRTIH